MIKFLALFLFTSLFAQTTAPCKCPCKSYEGRFADLPVALPCLFDPCHPSWRGRCDLSLLAWQAIEEGLDFAFKNNPRSPQAIYGTLPTRSDLHGELVGIDFNWMPAVKATLGIDFPCKGWEMDLRWTCFYSHNTHTAHAKISENGTGLFPLWLLPLGFRFVPQVYGTAKGNWQLHFNGVDWEIDYDFFLTRFLSFRFGGGLKGISVDQKFSVQYAQGLLSTVANEQAISGKTHLSNRVLGIGPRLGFLAKWRLKKGWSLLGQLAGDLPLCIFEIKRSDRDITSEIAAATHIAEGTYRESFWAYRPILEALLGTAWDTCLGAKNQYSFGLDLLYEIQYLWEQNMMRLLVAPPLLNLAFPERGDLTLHGATLNFRFGY